MTNEEFAELEAATWDLGDEHLDLFRIRCFALAMRNEVEKAKLRLERSKTAMMRAVARSERDLAEFNAACDLAERAGRFAARAMGGDVEIETRREAASALEELFG